jgi:hypothetical protein
MTPIDQDKFGARGNCEQAALASVLGLPLDGVPDFHAAPHFARAYQEFLAGLGFVAVVLPPDRAPDCYCVAVGPNKANGHEHACVYRAGKLVHDPHPGRHGLARVEEFHVIAPVEIDLS